MRMSRPAPPLSTSFFEPPINTSSPLPPLSDTEPAVKAFALSMLLESPPVRFAVSIELSVSVPKPVATRDVLVSVMSASCVTNSASIPEPPDRVAVPSQKPTVKELFDEPPVSVAFVKPVNCRFRPSLACNEEANNVRLAFLLMTTVSPAPPPPTRLPVPVQLLTVNVFALAPPVRFAIRRFDSTSVPTPVRDVFVNAKLTFADSLNVFEPLPPLSESLPSLPLSVSSPAPPLSVSAPPAPTSRSLPSPPSSNIGRAVMFDVLTTLIVSLPA